MKQNLTDEERLLLDKRTAEVERRTGAQIVLAVIERCDVYAELPWKAFALGTAVAGLAITLLDRLRPGWASVPVVLLAVVLTLATGAAAALLCVYVPGFARLFLDNHRAEAETRQYAQSLFLSRELFSTQGRTGALLLVSLFERQVVVLPDTGLRKYLGQDVLQAVIARVTAAFASGQVARALEEGLADLEKILSGAALDRSRNNELPDVLLEEEGL